MHIKKVLEIRLNIDDINDIFCADYDAMLLNILKRKFTGICYKSVYILDIVKILNRSNLNAKNKTLDGGLYVDVIFEVDGLVYENGDIIHGCKIVKIQNNGIIHVKSKYASLKMKNISNINIYSENDVIPAIVMVVKYNLFDPEISISAIPLHPLQKNDIYYKIKDVVPDDAVEGIKDEISILMSMYNDLSKKNTKVLSFFNTLLYPYNIIRTFKNTKKIKPIDLLSLKHGDMILDTDSPLYNIDILYVTDPIEETVIELNAEELYYKLISGLKKNINILSEFVENYDTLDKIKNTAHIWKAYTMQKL